jgi:hypothetical protein
LQSKLFVAFMLLFANNRFDLKFAFAFSRETALESELQKIM